MASAAVEKRGFIDINSVQNWNTASKEIAEALKSSEPRITFWGCRVVQVQPRMTWGSESNKGTNVGTPRSYSLNWIAKKIVELHKQPENFTHADFGAENEILQKVSEFYKATDELLNNANLVTRFFNWIRECSFSPYTTRFSVEDALVDFATMFGR